MRVVFLIPRRKDNGVRDRLWEAARRRMEVLHPDIPIFEGHHDHGAFNRSAAINRASSLADKQGKWDLGIVMDSDVVLSAKQVRNAIKRAKKTGRVTWAFQRWRALSEEGTKKVMGSGRMAEENPGVDDGEVAKTNPISWSCCFVIPRYIWDELGGFDERFQGWGWEDMAFHAAATGPHGHERIDGDLFHLFHPRSSERQIRSGLHSREYLHNEALGRRYMVALREEYHVTERHLPSTVEEIKNDAAHIRRMAVETETKDNTTRYHGWWPSLAELVRGAQSYRTGITLVVHTAGTKGGRFDYLEPSVVSLLENISGNFIKKVFYDDSGDKNYKDRLVERFGPLGFYVVGPDRSLGYTKSMQAMWQYLTNRCQSKWVFQVEDDFLYDKKVDLHDLIRLLEDNPDLTQVALLRRACFPKEIEAGGIINQNPDRYTRKEEGDLRWLEHTLFWTCNPCLFRRSLCKEFPWPNSPASERVYTDTLTRRNGNRMAFWGHGEEHLTHIGEVKAGSGY